jgi:hemerythrin
MSPPIVLDDALLTGHESIDGQHRELFARVDALVLASHEHRGRAEAARLLEYLGDYAVTHFAAEERAMLESGYPGYESHRAQHRDFVKEFAALFAEFKAEGPGPLFAIRVGNRVTDWLKSHIYRTDRQLAAWLRSAGKPTF